ncbi:hypothetical protein C0992_005868 [Termitomyces sp. T32_za158]|nr:hypothetical protein C0992_005868 [Termitomyces sp. T32_za158]
MGSGAVFIGWRNGIAFGVDFEPFLGMFVRDFLSTSAGLSPEPSVSTHDRKLAYARSEGVVVGKKRKEQSDKGKPRKGKGGQSKKKKTSHLPLGPTFKSAEFIDGDESDSSVNNDGSD